MRLSRKKKNLCYWNVFVRYSDYWIAACWSHAGFESKNGTLFYIVEASIADIS